MCSFIFGCSGPHGCMGFLKLQRAGATPSCGAPASLCGDLPYCGAWAPGHAGFSRRSTWLNSCSSRALEHRLSSCGAGARLFEACLTSWTRGQTPSPVLAADSLPLSHQGSLVTLLKVYSCVYSKNSIQ